MDNSIQRILTIMEDGMDTAAVGPMQGTQDAGMDIMPGDMAPDGNEMHDYCGDGPVTPDLLELARELIMSAGSADRAREIIDKVDEVSQILDIDDAGMISGMADMMPDDPDLPTGSMNSMGMSSMYNPGGGMHM